MPVNPFELKNDIRIKYEGKYLETGELTDLKNYISDGFPNNETISILFFADQSIDSTTLNKIVLELSSNSFEFYRAGLQNSSSIPKFTFRRI